MKIKCIITDDEPIARKGLQKYVDQIPFLDWNGNCADALELNQMLGEKETDLIFLDINMPHISGLDYLKTLSDPPLVIITTAYPDYALEGYELNVLDYLLKPISFERFLKAANKAKDYLEKTTTNNSENQGYFFLKCQKRIEKIFINEILFLESMQNYVRLHFPNQILTAHITLKSIKEQLPPHKFIQPHKSFLVALEKIQAIEGNQLFVEGNKIPISKHQKEVVLEKILNKRLFKK